MCRKCLLKHVIGGKIEGMIEVTGRQGGRGKQLLDGLKEKKEYRKQKKKELRRIVWGTRLEEVMEQPVLKYPTFYGSRKLIAMLA
jgi:hypothetical protein